MAGSYMTFQNKPEIQLILLKQKRKYQLIQHPHISNGDIKREKAFFDIRIFTTLQESFHPTLQKGSANSTDWRRGGPDKSVVKLLQKLTVILGTFRQITSEPSWILT